MRRRSRSRRPRARGRLPQDWVAACVAGRCIGSFCPCLCHCDSLGLAHYAGQLQRRRGRKPGAQTTS